ncbi:MAG TPA: hypothetical protein ENN09_05170 [Planctomycetes bacterium]|nr:hypothetical protein [Planctomycetota bacterium]
MTIDDTNAEQRTDDEKIPRRLRTLVGRLSAKIDRLEKQLAERPAAPPPEQDASAPAGGHEQPRQDAAPAAQESDSLPPDVAADVDRLIAVIAEEFAAPSGGGADFERGEPAFQPEPPDAPGASATPSAPPPADDPVRSANRRAQSVEAYLDSRFFGSE